MTSSLGLAGDLDDVALIEDIEESFGLRFSNDQLKHCRTIGDVFALVQASLTDANASATGCASAMCFYRMRRALQPKLGTELRPASPIDALKGLSVNEIYRIIRVECGFRPPAPVISLWGCIALLLVGILPLSAVALGASWWLAAASALPAIGLYSLAPIRLPSEVVTFGDLVRVIAARNIGKLADQGARLRASEAWAALKDVTADHTVLSKDTIAPDTLILAPRKSAA